MVVEPAERLGVALLGLGDQPPDVDLVVGQRVGEGGDLRGQHGVLGSASGGSAAGGSSGGRRAPRRRHPRARGAGAAAPGSPGDAAWAGGAGSAGGRGRQPAAPRGRRRTARPRGASGHAGVDLLVGPARSGTGSSPCAPRTEVARVLRCSSHGDNIARARPRDPGGRPSRVSLPRVDTRAPPEEMPSVRSPALARRAGPRRGPRPSGRARRGRRRHPADLGRAGRAGRPRRRRLRRPRADAGGAGGRAAAQRDRLAARHARCPARRAGRRPGEHRLHRPGARARPHRLRRRPAGRARRTGRRSPACRSAPGRRRTTARPPDVEPRSRGAGLPGLHERHHRPAARRDAHHRRAARQPGAVPGDGPAAGPPRRPRAAGAPAVPRLRPQRRLRAGRRHRRLRRADGGLRPRGRRWR